MGSKAEWRGYWGEDNKQREQQKLANLNTEICNIKVTGWK